MSLASLSKKKAYRVIGIDCSTQSLAYAVFEGGKPVTCGEVMFNGATVFERLNDARQKTNALVKAGVLVGDYVSMEAAIGGPSVAVTIKLSYVYGAVLSVLMQNKMEVNTVPPITWQSYIGNKNWTKAQKDQLKADNPGQKESWYKTEIRKQRKQKSLDFARQHFTIPGGSDNIGDAVGVAYYTAHELTR